MLHPSRSSYQLSRRNTGSDPARESRRSNRRAFARIEAGGGCGHYATSAGASEAFGEKWCQAQLMKISLFPIQSLRADIGVPRLPHLSSSNFDRAVSLFQSSFYV